jgi:ABC-type glycerol-3-phosphate transport system substrate-binding protein
VIEVDAETLSGLKVTFWHAWSGPAGEAIQSLLAAFNAENEYGIVVESAYQGNYNDLYDQIDAAIQAGDPPSLAVGYSYQIQEWDASQGIVADLAPYVNDPQWGLSPTQQADFNPTFWEQEVINGKRTGFPAQRSAQLIFYNTTWASELGFDVPPSTPVEFKQQACSAAQANKADADPNNDGTGGWVVNTSPSAVLSWIYAFRGQVIDPQGDGYRFNTPQTEAALTYLKELHDAGCAWQSADDYPDEEFAARRALFVTGSLSDLSFQRTAFERAGNPDRWTVLAFPSPQKQPVIDVYGPSFVLFEATAEEKLAAWLVVKWLTSPENQARLIAASGTYPIRSSTLDHLAEYAAEHPQWSAALQLLPFAQGEPGYTSWSVVRWVVSEVGTQVFRYYFTADRIPATLELMDETAAELHARSGE